jgi:isoleucyl-tRNA synthetase
MENNVFVILDTTLNEELINEGFAREMISRIQQMRKNNGYEMMDNIKIFYNADEEFIKGIDAFKEYLKGETLAKSVEISDDKEFEEYVLNDHNVKIFIERI